MEPKVMEAQNENDAANQTQPQTQTVDCSRVNSALRGHGGYDQQRIAATGIEWLNLLLAKNADYGSSAWKAPALCLGLPPGHAILVRMSDKIERIANLMVKDPEVAGESLEDSIKDLGAYCLLWLARPKGGV